MKKSKLIVRITNVEVDLATATIKVTFPTHADLLRGVEMVVRDINPLLSPDKQTDIMKGAK